MWDAIVEILITQQDTDDIELIDVVNVMLADEEATVLATDAAEAI